MTHEEAIRLGLDMFYDGKSQQKLKDRYALRDLVKSKVPIFFL